MIVNRPQVNAIGPIPVIRYSLTVPVHLYVKVESGRRIASRRRPGIPERFHHMNIKPAIVDASGLISGHPGPI